MTLFGPNIIILGNNADGAAVNKGSNIYSVLGYENQLDSPTRELAIQYMLSTTKGMHSFIAPLTFAPCTVLTPN